MATSARLATMTTCFHPTARPPLPFDTTAGVSAAHLGRSVVGWGGKGGLEVAVAHVLADAVVAGGGVWLGIFENGASI